MVFRDQTAGPRVEDVALGAPTDGEVEVSIRASGICGSDLHVLHGRSNALVAPAVLGHEGAGVVERLGPGVTRVHPGDRVVVAMAPGQPGRVTSEGVVLHPFVGSGSLAERVVVSERQVHPIPAGVPFEVAAISACGIMTGLGAVMNVAGLKPGAHTLVVGCGGVGLSVVQACRIAGAARVIAVDSNPAKEAIARRLGADIFATVPTAPPVSLVDLVRKLEPEGVDVAFEVVGLPELVDQALECTRPGGTCVAVAAYPPDSTIAVKSATLFMNRRLLGCAGGGGSPGPDLARIFELYLAGRLDLDAMVTARYPLERVNDAFAAAERGEVARAVVVT